MPHLDRHKPMQNSVAKYRLAPPPRRTLTPAPRFAGRVFRHRVDAVPAGLWSCHGSVSDFDKLTPRNHGVSVVSKGQGVDKMCKSAIFDDLTAKLRKQPHVHACAPAHMSECVCHVVNSSVVVICVYLSIVYLTDTGLTVFDTCGLGHGAGQASGHSLSGVEVRTRGPEMPGGVG